VGLGGPGTVSGAVEHKISISCARTLGVCTLLNGGGLGESAATILKYLMNTEIVLENYFGNILDPKRNHGRHAHRNALQDVVEVEGVSSRLSLAAVESKLQSLEQMIQMMAKAQGVNSVRQVQLVTSLTASIKKIEVKREYLTFRLEERQSNQVLMISL
jgi:bifunctional N-acetylglucosamine-1-phosphate-uridyltransferase/glucosamine-1-phosphate-acetyltransferase GlmU-like protein